MEEEKPKTEKEAEEEGLKVEPTDSDAPQEKSAVPSGETDDVLGDLGLESVSEEPKKAGKKAAPKEEDVSDSPFAGLDKPSKFPVILYLISFVLIGFGVFLGIKNGTLDAELSKALVTWGNDPANASLLAILIALPKILGGLLASLIVIVIGLVFVVIGIRK